jgi:preprotein translocase subunit SecE
LPPTPTARPGVRSTSVPTSAPNPYHGPGAAGPIDRTTPARESDMNREEKRRGGREERRTEDIKSAGSGPTRSTRTSPKQFLREVRSELRKVVWPNRKEVTSYTIVVLVTTVVLVAIVWGMDEVIRRAVINTLG